MELVNKIKNWFKYRSIFSTTWNEYNNPLYYWWKARKYFKRPKAHLVKGEYFGYFGLPMRTDSYHKGLNFFVRGLGWKDKYNSPRHEWDPIVCFVWVNPWKTWISNRVSKNTNSKGEPGFYDNKQYWIGWIFNWVKPNADWKNDSYTASMATWESILDFLYYNKTIDWCKENHIWFSDEHKITIDDNLK